MPEISVDVVLLNVAEELNGLGERLLVLEKNIISQKPETSEIVQLKPMQDMDLIVQLISDLSRTILCVSEVELSNVMMNIDQLATRLHLKDLHDRLVGATRNRHDLAGADMIDVQIF